MEKKEQSFQKQNAKDEFVAYYTSYYGSGKCKLGPSKEEKKYTQFMQDLKRNKHCLLTKNGSNLFREHLGLRAENIDTNSNIDLMSFLPIVKQNLKYVFSRYIESNNIDSNSFIEFFVKHWHQGGMANYLRAQLVEYFKTKYEYVTTEFGIGAIGNDNKSIDIILTDQGMLIDDSAVLSIYRLMPDNDKYENAANVYTKYVIFFNKLENPKIIPLFQYHELLDTTIDNDTYVKDFKKTLKNLNFNITKDLNIFLESEALVNLSHNNGLKNYENMSLLLKNYEKLLNQCQKIKPEHRYTIQLQQDLLDYQIELAQMINTNDYSKLNIVIDSFYSKIENIIARILNNKNFMQLMNTDQKTGFFSIFAGKSDFASIIEDLQTRLNRNKNLLNKNTPFPR